MAFNLDLNVEQRKGGRSVDRRRETSRYAARDRRGKEADIFTDLKDVVPVVEESTVTHVDRIALLRVASTLCRMRKHAGPFFSKDLMVEDNPNIWNEDSISECLDGFVILADSDGTILYITGSVSIFLGLTQTDLVGRGIKDFIHPSDYDELMRISTEEAAASEEHRSLDDDIQIHKYGHRMIMRMKTVISPRGRNLNLKSALFKAIVCRCRSIQFETGRIMLIHASTTPAGQGNSICMTNSSVKGSETTSGSFMTRHTCDMRFSYVSENFNFLLRHEPRSLMGTSFYELVHPADLDIISETMTQLFRKGHSRSPYYRLIGANNSVAWVQTEATTVNHTTRGQKGQYILCVHSLVGMQSEVDSWVSAGSACVDVMAAARPVCQFIKSEIEDVAEYLGRQPQYIDCHDFTPLIDSDAGINMSEYRPMRAVASEAAPQQTMNNPPRRKDSYNEVLEWLFRDQPESPPPHTNEPIRGSYDNLGNQGLYNSSGFRNQRPQQQFQPNRQQSSTNRGYSLEGRRDNRMGASGRAAPSQGPAPNQQQQLYVNPMEFYSRSSSIDSVRNSQPARIRDGAAAAPTMDDGNRFAHRAPAAAAPARARDANCPQSAYRDGMAQVRGGQDGRGRPGVAPISQGVFCDTGYAEQRNNGGRPALAPQFSPLTAGFAEFGVTSPEIEPLGMFPGSPTCPSDQFLVPEALTPFANGGYTNLSAVPASNEYFMSNVEQRDAQEPRNEPSPNMYSSMPPPGHKRHFEEDQAVTVDDCPVVVAPQPISREFFEEFKQQNPHLFPAQQESSSDAMCNTSLQCSSDPFEHLAPFVPEEDVYLLNSEPFPTDVNFPELDLSGFSYDASFGQQIEPNPFDQKQVQYMKRPLNDSNPAKRARLDSSYQASSY